MGQGRWGPRAWGSCPGAGRGSALPGENGCDCRHIHRKLRKFLPAGFYFSRSKMRKSSFLKWVGSDNRGLQRNSEELEKPLRGKKEGAAGLRSVLGLHEGPGIAEGPGAVVLGRWLSGAGQLGPGVKKSSRNLQGQEQGIIQFATDNRGLWVLR